MSNSSISGVCPLISKAGVLVTASRAICLCFPGRVYCFRVIGSAVLDNAIPDTVRLIDRSGSVVSQVTYTIGEDVRSYERILSRDAWQDERWELSAWVGGSPGRRNSISPKQYGLSLGFDVPPDSVLTHDRHAWVRLRVENRGFASRASAPLSVSWHTARREFAVGALAPGEHQVVDFTMPGLTGQAVDFSASIESSQDEDHTNDCVTWVTAFGVAPETIVINKLIPIPADGIEWVELLNRSPRRTGSGTPWTKGGPPGCPNRAASAAWTSELTSVPGPFDGVETGSALEIAWDGRDDHGRPVAPGTYTIVLESSGSEDRISGLRILASYAKGL